MEGFSGLGAAHIAVGRLQQLEDDVLHVLAHVAGLGESGGVHDGKGDIEHLGQGLGQQGLAGAGGPDEQDIGLGQLHVAALAVHVDALVVVVDGDRELLLGLLLADHVLVEEGLDLLRLGQVVGRGRGVALGAVVFQDGVADGYAFVADVGPGVIAGRGDELGDCILRLVTEGAAKNFVGAGSGLHGLYSLQPGCCLAIPLTCV
jgi:hypothetical protein